MIEQTGKLELLERMKSSRNGNPRYRLIISTADGLVSVVTKPDSSLGYVVDNYRGKSVIFAARMYRGNLTLTDIAGIERG